MNPEQPAPPEPGTPYDFIVNAKQPPKPVPLGVAGKNPFFWKLGLMVGGAIVFMIVAAVVVNLLFGNKTNLGSLTEIAETQSELMRVAAEGTTAQTQPVLNAATSAQLAITTQQKTMLSFLQKHGIGVSVKMLTLKKNAATDQQLKAATAASTFDTVFTQIMVGQLQSYSATLRTSYKNASASNVSERALLSEDYNQTQLLLKQWPAR